VIVLTSDNFKLAPIFAVMAEKGFQEYRAQSMETSTMTVIDADEPEKNSIFAT